MLAFVYKAELSMDLRHVLRACITLRKPVNVTSLFPLKVKPRIGIPRSLWYFTGCSEKEIAKKMAELIKDQFTTPPSGVLIQKQYESSTKLILTWNKTKEEYDVRTRLEQ